MNINELSNNDNSTSIYFYRPDLPTVDTSKRFEITTEGEKLRVKNANVTCLFSNLTFNDFDKLYNDFNRHLNLDFNSVTINGKEFLLDNGEKEKLTDSIITNSIYYYTINNLKVRVRHEDFSHPYMVDWVLSILDKKYGVDTIGSLTLGAKLLRQSLTDYTNTVSARRQYYDR